MEIYDSSIARWLDLFFEMQAEKLSRKKQPAEFPGGPLLAVSADYIYRQLSIWTDREGTMPPILK